MYKTIEEIRKEYSDAIRKYSALREAWSGVTIKTRKNGQEYAAVTAACVEGATIGHGYDGRKRLNVGGWSTGYASDSLDIETRDGYGPLEALTPGEVRDRIAAHMAWLWDQEQEARAADAWLEENAGGIFDKIAALKESIAAGAPDRQHLQYALGEIAGECIKYDLNRKYWR